MILPIFVFTLVAQAKSDVVLAKMNQVVDLSVPIDPVQPSRKDSETALNLGEVARNRPLVIFFFNESCGVTIYYKNRLQKLVQRFSRQGFTFVGVRTGQREDRLQPLNLPEPKYLAIPFFDDRQGGLLKEFNVKQSMTFAVIDRNRRLRYFGGFDDNVTESAATHPYLANALVDLVRGNQVRVPRSNSIGCAIIPDTP